MSNVPTPITPLALIFQHESLYWSCTSTVESRDGWVAFHSQRFPSRIDPNHAGEFRAQAGQGAAIVQDIIKFYQALGLTPAAYLDLLTTPEDLVAHFKRANFQDWESASSDLMLYLGPDIAATTNVTVEAIKMESSKADWASIMADEYAHDPSAQAQLQEYYFTQISDPRMNAYLIRVDGKPASRCQLFSSGGLGRVEAVRTDSSYRGRGLASAVVRQAICDSLEQNHTTYLYVEPDSAAQRLYHRLGFRTIAQKASRGFVWQG